MNKILRVSQATIHDLDELVHLFDEYRVFYKQASDMEHARKFLMDRLEHKESIIFIAKDMERNIAIGFTQLYPSFSSISMQRSWILNDLYVLDEHRGLGAARLLLESAKEYARVTEAKGLDLSTASDNVRAQRIYEQFGFKKDEEFFHYYLTL
ncbi:GNAT family N-acetyltransferase [Paenibacillus sp. JCM 10914]|uniref:GNAT family N-acetyltransferase n=1 Tax=Paenibacillus sp. JCM 10914 TaxID=1236974 RepID=UPI0003CC944B|nr:GNAT family N-acetyltransferase [Paenibacillus sp. JCM 10914]GAE06790.1 acetyltransferase, GNAT family [Paenibacillus sp. JCM 10914]